MTAVITYERSDNMITYSDTKALSPADLERLFLSVKWESGKLPDMLSKAMTGYKTVFTAWEGDRLAGLVSAMDDGVMTAYVHFLLVDPQYQGQGIGKRLMEMIKDNYRDYNKICLIADNNALVFYERLGFKKYDSSCPVFILN